MKILYLHPAAWTGEYAFLQHLVERGETVCVLEEKRGLGGARRLADHFRDPGDGIATLWYDPGRGAERLVTWIPDRVLRRGFDGRNLAHRMWIIREAVRQFRPDVLACTDGFTYAIPAAFLRRLGLLAVPVVASYIGGDILDCPEAAVGRRRTPMTDRLIRASLRGIDAMRPLCESLERILLRDGADPRRIHRLPIHLVAPLGRLEAIRARRVEIGRLLRAKYSIPGDAPLVVTLSGNQKGKGLQLLAAEWQAIRAAVPGCIWLLCGPEDPWLAAGVRPFLERMEESVRFTGRLAGEEVFEHLAAGDLHVNPTLCEGLNMVTVEAAAVGTPTVTSDGAGIADWVTRFDCGAVVPAADAVALREAVIDALRDADMRAAWRERCPAMTGDFAIEHVATQFLGILRSTLRASN